MCPTVETWLSLWTHRLSHFLPAQYHTQVYLTHNLNVKVIIETDGITWMQIECQEIVWTCWVQTVLSQTGIWSLGCFFFSFFFFRMLIWSNHTSRHYPILHQHVAITYFHPNDMCSFRCSNLKLLSQTIASVDDAHYIILIYSHFLFVLLLSAFPSVKCL